jgi:phosphoribosyl 1,2-cyclic phosphodiesterase
VRASGIAHLAGCAKLAELRFDGGLINDSDIDSIAGLKSLRWLVLCQTRVTRAGRDRLSKLRPDAAIHWSESAMISR